MATFAQIDITFFADMDLGTSISFQGHALMAFNWVNARYAPGQIEVGTPTGLAGERTALNLMAAFYSDYNIPYRYDAFISGNTLSIRAKDPTIEFSNFSNPYDRNVTAEITDYVGPTYTLTSVIFSTATTNPQGTHYKVNITTSLVTKSVTGTVTISNNTANPFSFEMPRGQGFDLLLTSNSGQTLEVEYADQDVPEIIEDIPIPPEESGSAVRYRIGVGHANDNLTNADVIIKLPAFTFDRTDIMFDTTLRTFDEIPV